MELKNNKIKNTRKKKDERQKKFYRLILAPLLIIFSCGLGILAATLGNVLEIYDHNTNKMISFGSLYGIKEGING